MLTYLFDELVTDDYNLKYTEIFRTKIKQCLKEDFDIPLPKNYTHFIKPISAWTRNGKVYYKYSIYKICEEIYNEFTARNRNTE